MVQSEGLVPGGHSHLVPLIAAASMLHLLHEEGLQVKQDESQGNVSDRINDIPNGMLLLSTLTVISYCPGVGKY